MTYESSTPFINASLAEQCLSVEFNRPDALNALRPEMLSEAARLVRLASDDAEVKVIVLRGAGRAFSAGVDLKVLQGIKPEGGIIGNVFDEPAAELAAAIRDSSVPVIARAVGAVIPTPNSGYARLGECRKHCLAQWVSVGRVSSLSPLAYLQVLKRSNGAWLTQALIRPRHWTMRSQRPVRKLPATVLRQ